MLDLIYDKWTANGSDIEMLFFILILLVCFLVVCIMSHISNVRIMNATHLAEIERIKRYGNLRKINK